MFEKLKAARDAGKRGTELIKQLMTFARREELDVGTIDPRKVVGDLLPLLRRALGARITLETTLQENVGAVRASVAQLESVVVNLAVNARDAIEGKGRISIEVAAADVSRRTRRRCAGSRAAGATSPSACAIPAAAFRRRRSAACSSRSSRRKASAAARASGSSMVRWFAEHSGGSRGDRQRRRAGDDGDAAAAAPARRSKRPMPTTGRCRCRRCRRVPSASWCSRWMKRLRATIHQTLEVLGYRVKVASGAEDLLAAVAAEPTDAARGRRPRARRRGHLDPRARIAAEACVIIATADPGRAAERVPGLGVASLAKPFTLADLAGTVRRTLDAPRTLRRASRYLSSSSVRRSSAAVRLRIEASCSSFKDSRTSAKWCSRCSWARW